jgi:hypothetical protein
MNHTYGRNFWRQAFERAVKTAVQGMIALVPADTFNILDVDDWRVVAGAALTGFLLSLGTSIVTAPAGQPDDPSLVRRTNP